MYTTGRWTWPVSKIWKVQNEQSWINGWPFFWNYGRPQDFRLLNHHSPTQGLRALAPALLSQKQSLSCKLSFTVTFHFGTVLRDNWWVKWYSSTDNIHNIPLSTILNRSLLLASQATKAIIIIAPHNFLEPQAIELVARWTRFSRETTYYIQKTTKYLYNLLNHMHSTF